MSWDDWFKHYDHSPSLQARLQIVRAQTAKTLDECPVGPIHVISMCAGDGRDLLGALLEHPRRADVRAWFLDTHADSLARGQAAAAAAGLGGQAHFRQADAGRAASYAGIPRAQLILLSGFLGHLRPPDALRLLERLPALLAPGGIIIWNRHQVMNGGRLQVPALRACLKQHALEEIAFQSTDPEGFAVGRCRFTGSPAALDPNEVFFELNNGPAPLESDAPGPWVDAEQSIPECFERVAGANPDRMAVITAAAQITYRSLNASANAVAHALISRGARTDRVALLMRHDAPLIAAILGILKAGRVVVVLNPSDPPARLQQLLIHAGAAVILTDLLNCDLAQNLSGPNTPVLVFEDMPQSAVNNPNCPIASSDLAWLIYTSGSTGTAKAVMQTHRNILHNAMRNAQGLDLTPDDRVLWMASPSGGQGVGTLCCTLLHGATLCPFPAMERGVTGLADWIRDQRLSIYVSAASIFRNFMRTLDETVVFSDMRTVRLASEPATFDDFIAFRKHFGRHCTLLVTLSSTETGNITQCRLRHDDVINEGRLPVGVASTGIEILLLDENGQAAPDGKAGEVVVRSRYLSPGYWKNDPLTAERFMDGPPSEPRQYRMGDQARRLPDGRLMFMGRRDNQIKIHGFRIEGSEVETVLEQQPTVEKSLVCAGGPEGGLQQLVAYIVPRRGPLPVAEELRAVLRTTLPGYMIPSAIIFLEAFPLNAHGKIDRTRLPAPPAPATTRPKVRRPARDEVEKRLAGIWQTVLHLSEVGWDENFFDLGGDSLQALAIVASIEREFGQLPPLSIFLDAGTLAAQADILCQGWTARHSTIVPLRAAGARPPLFCVHGAGGEVLSFTALARCLDPGQPVLGLQSPGLLGEWPPKTFEDFARRQVREILRHCPSGPCSLLGHCAGGLLALEIARQLANAGKPVKLVALVDTLMPGVHPLARSHSPRRRFTDRAAHLFRALRSRARLGVEALLHRPTQRFSAPYRRFADYAFKQAMRHYHVQPYAGSVAAFKADAPEVWNGRDVRDVLIQDILPHAQVFDVPGDHASCLRAPHVETLAKALRTIL